MNRTAFAVAAAGFIACSAAGKDGDAPDLVAEDPDAGAMSEGGAGASVDGGDAPSTDGSLACAPLPADGSLRLPTGKVCSIHGACGATETIAADLTYAWGASPDDVWLASDHDVVHFVNQTTLSGLTALPTGPGFIHGRAADDVWIGTLHWDGSKLRNLAKPAPGAAWMIASDDGWAVHGLAMAHWDGVSWTDRPTPAMFPLTSVVAFGSNDVYASGGPAVLHWDGASWSAVVPALPVGATANKLWALPGHELWASGNQLRRLTTEWAAFPLVEVLSVASDGAGGAQVVVREGAPAFPAVKRITGTTVLADARRSSLCATATGSLSTCACTGTYVLGADAEVFVSKHYRLNPNCSVALYRPATQTFEGKNALTGLTASERYLLRKDGSLFTWDRTCSECGLWGVSSTDTVVGLSGRPDDDDVWLSGYYRPTPTGDVTGLASHWDGTKWTYKVLASHPGSPVHAQSRTSAWVLTTPAPSYFDGTKWVVRGFITEASASTGMIWGDGPNRAVVVRNYDLLAWDGTTWSVVPGEFVAVGGRGTPRAVARDGRVFVWNGTAMADSGQPALQNQVFDRLPTMFAFEGEEIWAVTLNDAKRSLLRWTGCWRSVETGNPHPSTRTLHSVAVYGRSFVAFGTNSVRGTLGLIPP